MQEDTYKSLAELKQAEDRSSWEQIVSPFRGRWLAVVAPHAGCIEPHTGDIAIAIARSDFSWFVFKGRRSEDCYKYLHVTSTNFRDPGLTEIQNQSKVTLSIHGAKDRSPGDKCIWVGGLNSELRRDIVLALVRAEFTVIDAIESRADEKYAARSTDNFVNVTRDHGVQIEISRSLRQDMFNGSGINESHQFLKIIRNTLFAYGAEKYPAGNS